MTPVDYEIRGRMIAQTFWGEMEKIAKVHPFTSVGGQALIGAGVGAGTGAAAVGEGQRGKGALAGAAVGAPAGVGVGTVAMKHSTLKRIMDTKVGKLINEARKSDDKELRGLGEKGYQHLKSLSIHNPLSGDNVRDEQLKGLIGTFNHPSLTTIEDALGAL